MRALIFTGAFCCLLAGCAGKPSVSEHQCAVGDWETIGYRDGVNGNRSTALLRHQDACMEHGIAPNRASYMSGWEQGAREYCEPSNAYHIGERGWSHNNICPTDLRAGFLTAYQEGRRLYEARVTVANLEWEIDQKTGRLDAIKSEIISAGAAQLDPELTVEQRVELGTRVQRLLDEQTRLKQELPDLEAELAIKSRELDRLSGALAMTERMR
jgi:hypothetical protein